ncbi:hypothetical protein J2X19_005115 [Rhodoferax ferrireducens]|uniref:Uncharacterized protein n=1 Tax=Rhodoferax ferrireducens TaxID=192843 RepID=A0ABU2CGF4_9BURK|nr:hypothetical protein [Rhodoferax ferrireducens]MDR7380408.1 hypothetical protein [Rhodoferax ferrireducens]
MTFESMEGQRRDTSDSIIAKFGASIEKAEQNAATKTTDPAMRKLMGARMALEYAVLATAREKNMATEMVATALKGATVVQQAAMLKEGSAALGRAYKVEPEVLANVFAGRLNDVEMPKGLGSTPEIDKMVDTCRSLVTSIIKDEYPSRGRFEAGGRSDSFIALKSEGIVEPAKTELAARLAFVESSIDAAVGKGAINQVNADMLKERIEAQVFQPRPPQSLQYSKEFTSFFEQRGKGIRIDAMKEVRGVTQSLTVQEIATKLKMMIPSTSRLDRPSDHRAHKPMER